MFDRTLFIEIRLGRHTGTSYDNQSHGKFTSTVHVYPFLRKNISKKQRGKQGVKKENGRSPPTQIFYVLFLEGVCFYNHKL